MSGNLKIPQKVIEYINNTPDFSSMLYDLDMMPEQLQTDGAIHGLRACYYIYKELRGRLNRVEKERDEMKAQVNTHKNFLEDLQVSNEVIFEDKSDTNGNEVLCYYSRADIYPICYSILEAWERFKKEAGR